jgi:Secretion system C-terminal sorting domain
MKKNITITCLLLSIFALNAQISFKEIQQKLPKQYQKLNFQKAKAVNRGNVLCLPDSTVTFGLAENGIDSFISSKTYNIYNSNGSLTKQTNYELDDNDILTLTTENVFTYNAQNVLINDEQYSLNSNDELELNNCTKYYPKANSTTLIDSTVTWTIGSNGLERSTKEVNNYDANGLILQTFTYEWDVSSGWTFTDRQDFLYSPTNKPVSGTAYEWNDPTWEATTQTDFVYDALDSLTSFTNTDLSTNQPTDRAVFTYNTAENSTNSTIELWTGTEWVLLFNTFLDNSAANQIEQLDIFIDFPGFLTIGTRQVYIFPNGNDCAGFANIYVSEDNVSWTYLGRTFLYYNGSTIPTNSLINNGLALDAMPNPFTEKLVVSTAIDTEIKVFSTTGNLLLETKSKDENTVLNTESLPIGTYFIVVNKNGKSDRKLVVKG